VRSSWSLSGVMGVLDKEQEKQQQQEEEKLHAFPLAKQQHNSKLGGTPFVSTQSGAFTVYGSIYKHNTHVHN